MEEGLIYMENDKGLFGVSIFVFIALILVCIVGFKLLVRFDSITKDSLTMNDLVTTEATTTPATATAPKETTTTVEEVKGVVGE